MGNYNTARHASWAQRKREDLIEKLGGKCVKCGTREDLEIDHINGRDWNPREYSQKGRVIRYCREFVLGLLQVLCGTCNKEKGGRNW